MQTACCGYCGAAGEHFPDAGQYFCDDECVAWELASLDVCAACGAHAELSCADCGTNYCCAECQREAWPEHMAECQSGLTVKKAAPKALPLALEKLRDEVQRYLGQSSRKDTRTPGWETSVKRIKVKGWNVFQLPVGTVLAKGVDVTIADDQVSATGGKSPVWFGNVSTAQSYAFRTGLRKDEKGKIITVVVTKTTNLLDIFDDANRTRIKAWPKISKVVTDAFAKAFPPNQDRLSGVEDLVVANWLCDNVGSDVVGWAHMKPANSFHSEVMLCARGAANVRRLPYEIRYHHAMKRVVLVDGADVIQEWTAAAWELPNNPKNPGLYTPDKKKASDKWLL